MTAYTIFRPVLVQMRMPHVREEREIMVDLKDRQD